MAKHDPEIANRLNAFFERIERTYYTLTQPLGGKEAHAHKQRLWRFTQGTGRLKLLAETLEACGVRDPAATAAYIRRETNKKPSWWLNPSDSGLVGRPELRVLESDEPQPQPPAPQSSAVRVTPLTAETVLRNVASGHTSLSDGLEQIQAIIDARIARSVATALTGSRGTSSSSSISTSTLHSSNPILRFDEARSAAV